MNTAIKKSIKQPERSLIWGQNIPLGNDYVRKEAFDAHLKRLETLMDRNLIEQKAMNQSLEAKIEAVNERLEAKIEAVNQHLEGKIETVNQRLETKIEAVNQRLEGKIDSVRSELKGDIKALDAKIYALDGKLSQNLVITGIIVAVFGIITTIVTAAIQFWR